MVNPNSLCVDTSTPRAYLSLRRHSDLRCFAATVEPGRKHGRDLLPAIRDLLAEADVKPLDLGSIRVGLGPGSYTGLRVGVTAAKTLAYASGAHLYGFGSLDFFANAAPEDARRIVAISDAQRGDFHVAEFGRVEGHSFLTQTVPTTIEDRPSLTKRLSEGLPAHVIGPGLDRWDGVWPEGVQLLTDVVPGPHLMRKALHGIERFHREAIFALEPIYLRRSAAEDLWETRK